MGTLESVCAPRKWFRFLIQTQKASVSCITPLSPHLSLCWLLSFTQSATYTRYLKQ